MNKQEIAQKILDFCKNRYPEINWEQPKYIKSAIHIRGKLNEIYINVEVSGIKSHVVLGNISLIISSKEMLSSISEFIKHEIQTKVTL